MSILCYNYINYFLGRMALSMLLADPHDRFMAIYYKNKIRSVEETPLALLLSSISEEIISYKSNRPVDGFVLSLIEINDRTIQKISIKIGSRLCFIPLNRHNFQSEHLLEDIRDFFNSHLGDIYEAHITTNNELEVNFK